jgi:hypothetical protein
MISRILAGTVMVGSLAFAAQVDAQTQGQAGGARPERTAEGRGGRGERSDPAQMVERRVARLTEELKLTSGQSTAVRQILLEEQTQMATLRPDGGPGGRGGRGGFPGDSGARGERRQRPDSAARAEGRQRPDSATMARMRAEMDANRAEMDALRKQTDTRIEGVLSTEQRTAYRALAAKRGDRPEGGPGGRGGRGGPGRGGDRQAPPPVK